MESFADTTTVDDQLRKRVAKFDFVNHGVTGDITTPEQLYIDLALSLFCYTGHYPAKLNIPVRHEEVWMCYHCKDMWYPERFVEYRRQQIKLIPYCDRCEDTFSNLHPAQQNRILFTLPQAQLLLWGEARAIC